MTRSQSDLRDNARKVFGLDDESGPDQTEIRNRIWKALVDSTEKPGKPFEKKFGMKSFMGLDPEITGEAPETKKKTDLNDGAKSWMKRQRWVYERCDYYDARTERHHDLFGIFDYLAFDEAKTIGVQITSVSSMSTRRAKILSSSHLETLRKAGWKIVVLGVYKEEGRWQAKTDWIL